MNSIELMCPAGDFKSLSAAIKAGADSVYFGVGELNMRSNAANFSTDDLEEIVEKCKENGVKSYLTLNTVMYNEDLESMEKVCDRAKEAGLDAVIASDIAVIKYCNKIGLEVHMSTQANISNIEAVKFYSEFADTVVLARELSLQQIKEICGQVEEQGIKGPNGENLKIEVFAHGALCVAVSGKCYMSLAQYDSSANRGQCLQPCRREYEIKDKQTGDELVLGNDYVMSPKDLCTIGMIDKLVESGAKVFKIEGRARGPEYVYTVVKTYKEAIKSVEDGSYSEEKIDKWREKLGEVFNRGLWEGGYYMGDKTEMWSGEYGTKATKKKVQVGKVTHYFPEPGVGVVKVLSEGFEKGDQLLFTGKTTGALYQEVNELRKDDEKVEKAEKKDLVTVKVRKRVRENDKVYVIKDREEKR